MADAKAGAIALVPDRTRVTCEGFRKGMGNHFFRPGVTDMNAWLRLTHDGVSLIARCRVEDDAVLPSPNLGDGLKATGDHVRLSFRGKDAGTRMVLVGPTPAGCQAALIADGKAKPLRVTGKPFPGGYEAEVRFALADAGLAPGATALFDVAVCDADSRADDVDSEFVWSGAAHDPLDAGGYGEITLSP
jgi:hypothetical protein